jgi:hypothetical protein
MVKTYLSLCGHCSIIQTSQGNLPKYTGVVEWIINIWYKHTVEYYSVLKEGNIVICENMINLEDIMLSELSQAPKNKHHMSALVCRC